MSEEDHLFEIEITLCTIVLLLYIFFAHIIEINFIHESGVAIIMGAIMGLIIYVLGNKKVVEFSHSGFFTFILPPIIFSAGYTLKRKNFIKNFGYIMLFGICGTIVSMIALAFLITQFNHLLFVEGDPMYLNDQECLLVASVLCATDTVAALAIVKDKEFPVLNSILFGEGVVNDAVSILLFRAVDTVIKETEAAAALSGEVPEAGINISGHEVLAMFGDFVYLSIASVLVGIFFGFFSSLILKQFPSFKKQPVRETSIIIFMGYLSYLVAELFHLSGIMTLFCSGFTMSHYAYYNISEESQHGTVLAMHTIGHATEAFLFTYLGLTIFVIEKENHSTAFTIGVLVSTIIGRAFTVFLPIFLLYISQCGKIRVTGKQLAIIWFAGLIRGAIAFALSLQIESHKKDFMTNTVLIVVLVTTLVFGAMMSPFAKVIGLAGETDNDSRANSYEMLNDPDGPVDTSYLKIRPPSLSESSTSRDSIVVKHENWLQRKWKFLDNNFVKPIFGGDLSKTYEQVNYRTVDRASETWDEGQRRGTVARNESMILLNNIATMEMMKDYPKEQAPYIARRTIIPDSSDQDYNSLMNANYNIVKKDGDRI